MLDSAASDTVRVMVVNGSAPTAASRARTAAALRARLSSEFSRTGEKARVLSRTETCATVEVGDQLCDSPVGPEYVDLAAASLHASLVIWMDVDSNAHRTTTTPYVLVPPRDFGSFEEGWSERMSSASSSSRDESLRKLAHEIPRVLAELPLINRCRSEWDATALGKLLPDARALLSSHSGSALAKLCMAKILSRAHASPDSVLAVTSAILSHDTHNRMALSIAAATLDRAMLMDSANVLWRELDEPTHAVVDSSAGIIHFGLQEVPGRNGGDPGIFLWYKTSREYSCLLPLTAEYRARSDTIVLGPFRLPAGPVDCPSAVGPAVGERAVALAPGTYVLNVAHVGKLDKYSIEVTDSTIAARPTTTPTVSMISDTLQWRVRHNSFVLSCGASEEAPWLCADAVRAILSTRGIVPLPTPPVGPYQFSGQNGSFHNEPPHFFRYANFDDYHRALLAAFTVYEKIIGRQMGYVLTFGEWRGQEASTWLRKKLPPLRDNAAPQIDALSSISGAPQPKRIASQFRARQIGLGADLSCALTAAANVLCWGRNDVGQLGTGSADTMAHPIPATIRLRGRVKQLSVGRDHACALLDEGSAYCWGSNALGQIGAPTTELCLGDSPAPAPCAPTPVRVAGDFHFMSLSAGVHSTCGVTVEHTAVCWGYVPTISTDSLQPPRCGDTLSVDRCAQTPQVVARALWTWKGDPTPIRHSVAALANGAFRTCALDDERQLFCWGFSASWGHSIGSTPVLEGDGAIALAMGYRHACALDDTGTASCWGWRDLGALGAGDSTQAREDERYAARFAGRRAVVGELRFREIAAGWLHTCGITRDTPPHTASDSSGMLFCWGDNSSGQLGVPQTVDDTMTFALTDTSDVARIARRRGHATPARVDLPSAVLDVALGIEHSCAIVSGGAVYCWGRNLRGALGSATTVRDDWHPRSVVEFGARRTDSPSPR